MSPDLIGNLLTQAEEKRKANLWSEAALLMEKAAAEASERTKQAEFLESVGYCQSRAARQEDSCESFRERIELAAKNYLRASELYAKDGEENAGKRAECRMLAEFSAAWLASTSARKKKKLISCLASGENSALAFQKAGNIVSFGRIRISMLRCLLELLYIASDSKELGKIAKKGIKIADEAINTLVDIECRELLVEAYSLASLQGWYAANVCEEPDKAEELAKRSSSFSERAGQLSASLNSPFLAALSNWALAISTLFFTENAGSSFEFAMKMNHLAKEINDNYLVGVSYYVLALVSDWMAIREADSNKKKKQLNLEIEFAKKAVRCLEPLAEEFFVAQALHLDAESLAILARSFEVGPKEKRALLEEAVEIGRAAVLSATRSGSPDAMGVAFHALSKTLQFYSDFEDRKGSKKPPLEEALVRRQSYNEVVQKTFPKNDWVTGVGMSYAGLIKRDLSKLEIEPESKRKRLESAVADLREGVYRCRKVIAQRSIPARVMAVACFEEGLADTLCQLYRITKEETLLVSALQVNQDAAEDFRKINVPNRAAECYWRIAMNQNHLGDHGKASEAFMRALDEYENSAGLLPDFSDFYRNYATYMRAWSEIEKATLAHERERYGEAVEHFRRVSSILERSRLWGYFAPNFKAWSILEQGEDLSRNERTDESLQAFGQARELFRKARQVFEKAMDRIRSPDEKEKAIELSKTCIRRADYCAARELIEAAKIDDRNGEYNDSADRYCSAASILEGMLDTVENETERKEIASFTCMVRAWQRMKMADARSSPDLYAQASELFSKAKTCDLEDKQMLLASGNSAICKALEHGMLFEETRRKAEFSKAKNHLESALGFYLRAGLERASEWTAATEILLDAYSYLTDAEKEVNLSNRTRKLLLAEKCFEQSAKLYQRANYSGRRDEVIKVIAKVRQKREFTLSLGKLLTTPGEASTTKAIPAPTLAIGEAVGLDKFERELIQANLVTPKRDVLTAEDFSIELHVANLGKTPTFLVKAENMLQEGLDAIVESPTYDIENHDVDTKGKRLDPSQSITFKFKLRSLSKGVLEIKPKIVCLDETGRQAFYEPEPLTIRVTETILPKRVTTGHRELDLLSMGGIPKNFAVLLSSTSSDERATLIYDFLESGARNDQVTFYVAVDIRGKERLAEQSSKFWVFICNPRADEMVKDKPNVSKLKGVENLTDISIALTSALRNLETSELENRRLCLEIISDVLLHHHAVSTRRWLASIIPEFRSHGFTTLAVLNPQMHPAQEVQAILDIFDGEITIQEKQTNKGPQKLLAIRRLSNEKYLTSELSLKTQNDRLL